MQRFGPYRVVRSLGQGASALVLEGEHEETLERVALRVPLLETDTRPERWLEISRVIDCPHVVRWHGVVWEGYRWAFVCDLVGGVELERLRVSTVSSAWRRGLALVALHDIGVALTAMHEAALEGRSLALVHGDLSPSNVRLRPDGTCVLMDLGETRRTALSHYTGHTVVGTPGYIAPELIRGAAPTFASDLFALGALGYAAWFGRDAFSGETEQEVLEATIGTQPDLPGADSLADLLRACLQKRPERRPTSARRVAEQVASLVQHEALDVTALRRATALTALALTGDGG